MFEFFKFNNKKKDKDFELSIYAPLSGEVIPIEEAEDQVFAQKAVGDGVAINPTTNTLIAPCNGVVKMIHGSKHAVVINTDTDVEVLLHLGIDTVTLKGSGFTALVVVGQKVKKGDPLIEFDMDYISKHAKSTQSMVVISNLEEKFIDKLPPKAVKAGIDVLYTVSNKKKTPH